MVKSICILSACMYMYFLVIKIVIHCMAEDRHVFQPTVACHSALCILKVK